MVRLAKDQRGFTITELSLAMSLLSVLMFILIISTMNFINIYNKGITLKRVDQSGANISRELQANLSRSDQVVIRCANFEIPTPPATDCRNTPTGLAVGLCAGDFSFVWSVYPGGTGATNQLPIPAATLTYSDGSQVYFAKVRDPSKDMCKNIGAKPYKGSDTSQPYQSSELLNDGLVVRDPSIPTNKGGLDILLNPENKLTTVIYTLSTNGGDDIISDGTNRATCQGGHKDAFCTLNTFVVTSYSRGVYN